MDFGDEKKGEKLDTRSAFVAFVHNFSLCCLNYLHHRANQTGDKVLNYFSSPSLLYEMNRDVFFSIAAIDSRLFACHAEISGAKRQLVDKLQKSKKKKYSRVQMFLPSIFTLPTIFFPAVHDEPSKRGF